jgi:hypothetical protein
MKLVCQPPVTSPPPQCIHRGVEDGVPNQALRRFRADHPRLRGDRGTRDGVEAGADRYEQPLPASPRLRSGARGYGCGALGIWDSARKARNSVGFVHFGQARKKIEPVKLFRPNLNLWPGPRSIPACIYPRSYKSANTALETLGFHISSTTSSLVRRRLD